MEKIIKLLKQEKIRYIENEYAANSIYFWRTDLGKGIDGLVVFKEDNGFTMRYFRADNTSVFGLEMYPIIFKTLSEENLLKHIKNLVIPRPEFF